MTGVEDQKRAAAEKALDYVEDGMLVGLGTGSTVRHFIEGVGRMVAGGKRIRGVPTSRATAELAAQLGIPVVTELAGTIDLAVDGADEVDPDLNLIKGRGGALFREKLVAACARQFVVVVDQSKLVDRLGAGVLPVEVLPFLWRTTAQRLFEMGLGLILRGGEETPYTTDNGNVILDLAVPGGIANPRELGDKLKATLGVVEHGLFAGMADVVIVADRDGPRVLKRR